MIQFEELYRRDAPNRSCIVVYLSGNFAHGLRG